MGMRHAIRMALAGVVMVLGALGLAACQSGGSAPAPMPVVTTVLDDALIAKIHRGQTSMGEVRALIDAKPMINYQAGREIWIYQGIDKPGSTQARTLTVQYDERGLVRNVGFTDLK
jgi:hypothetical protein